MRHAELALLAALALLPPLSARAAEPDEPTNLRVTRDADVIHLEWAPPLIPADTYAVRRCVLSSVSIPFYGNCIAEGLTAEQHDDPEPVGTVFYLVSGIYGGIEGSLGHAHDGAMDIPRTAPPCSAPFMGGPIVVAVELLEAVPACGALVRYEYDVAGVTYQSAACVDVTGGMLSAPNALEPPVLTHGCIGSAPGLGPGTLSEATFVQADCPAATTAFRLLACSIVTDCGTGVTRDADCAIVLR